MRGWRRWAHHGRDFHDMYMAQVLRTKAAELHVRCTVYNHLGDMVHHGKSLHKGEFMHTFSLAPRDFRKMARPARGELVPLLLARRHCILVNLLSVRALIRSDSVVVFDRAYERLGESHAHGALLQDLSLRLKREHPEAEQLPYEFRALETILQHVAGNLAVEMSVHKTVLENILASLERGIDRTRLRYLLIESKKLRQFHQKAKLIGDLLDNVLANDDELNDMYLSEIARGLPRRSLHHEEVELLLELYHATVDEIVQTAHNLTSQIKTSEEIIRFVLDSNRNELMVLGLRFSVGLLATAGLLYVAALYGMNLENFIEERTGGFEVVVTLGVVCFAVLFAVFAKHLRRVQKLTMNKATHLR